MALANYESKSRFCLTLQFCLIVLDFVKGGDGIHRKVTCMQCGAAKRSTLVDKVTKFCKVCDKKPSTEVNVEIAPLTSKALGLLKKRPMNERIQQNQIE